MVPYGGLVGGCGARAVSRKTPIYFKMQKETKKYLLHEGVGWGDHLSSLLFQSTPTIATSHKNLTHSLFDSDSCEIVVNAKGGFANPDDDDCGKSRSILVSP